MPQKTGSLRKVCAIRSDLQTGGAGDRIRSATPQADHWMTKRDKAQRISEILDRLFPSVDVPLQHRDPFTLLVAVVLSAQTTDKLVNQVTPALFARAATPAALADLPVEEIKQLIRRIGLSATKAKNLKRLSEILEAAHGARVPQTLHELEALPGVGPKTSPVLLNQGFGHATFAVDTHI